MMEVIVLSKKSKKPLTDDELQSLLKKSDLTDDEVTLLEQYGAAAKRDYMKQWHRTHPDKDRVQRAKYWAKRAAQMADDADHTAGTAD